MKARFPMRIAVPAGALLPTSHAPGGPGIVITTLVMEGDSVTGVGDRGTVGITDFLDLVANWGVCR